MAVGIEKRLAFNKTAFDAGIQGLNVQVDIVDGGTDIIDIEGARPLKILEHRLSRDSGNHE